MRADGGGRLLLHVCCGPCSIMPVRRLQEEGFEITAWYHNPNIQPLGEYLRRREAVLECAGRLGIAVVCDDAAWNLTEWLRAVRDRDTPPQRCAYCCRGRVAAAYAYAAAHGYDVFSTSLLYSRYQPHELIAAEGAPERTGCARPAGCAARSSRPAFSLSGFPGGLAGGYRYLPGVGYLPAAVLRLCL